MRAPLVRWTLIALAGLVLLATLAAAGGYAYLRGSLPRTEGELALPGLDAPVEVVRDGDGIPTIRAAGRHDAYRALGFLHAQDRLWQMDFMRRTAAGRLSEVVGGMTLGIDKFMRVMDFHGLAEAQLPHLSAETRAALTAYAEGVNAFLAREPVLPPEFHVLGYEPERWTPADSLTWLRIMALQLSGNWREEITRARLAERLTPEQIDFLYPETPADAPTTIATTRQALRDLPLDGLATLLPEELEPKSASNAWIVDGARTAGGQPILANDPHLGLQAPGYWYLARIETPEETLVGATAPGTPFMVLGRNDHLAWGLTTTHSDTQDLFIEKVHPDDPSRYRTPDGWAAFETREARIPVDGRETPETFTVRATRHGPVISDSIESARGVTKAGHVLALAWPALRADDRTPDAILAVNRAGSVAEALASLDRVDSPQQNIHLADDQGNIAVAAPARVPIRRNGNGMHPVPGWTGEHDWQGFIDRADLPRTVNPADGRIVNANNRLVPDDYPYLIAQHWPPPDRAARINALLDAAAKPFTPQAMTAIQLDIQGATAAILLPTLLDHAPDGRWAREAVTLLRGWDLKMARERPEPLIFVAWMDHLNRALFQDELSAVFGDFTRPRPRVIERAVAEDSAWCDDTTTADVREDCAGIVSLALEQALDSLERRFGGEPGDWRWGEAHNTALPHPLFSRLPVVGGLFGEEIATDGGDETVNRGGSRYGGSERGRYAHIHGPGLRAVHDLSRGPESSLFMIATGQSGNPLSPHYLSLAEAWRDGRFVKLVGEAQEGGKRLRLIPAQR